MSKVIKLKKGLDIKLFGEASEKLTRLPLSDTYAINPDDFKGVTPKMLVKVDDVVKAGEPLFFDKYNPKVLFSSPVSGRVSAINRGDKRKIMNIVVAADKAVDYKQFEVPVLANSSREQIIELMLSAGLWPMVIERPYGRVANPDNKPKAIFVSGFDSAPLAPDMNFALSDQADNLNKGFEVLGKLTDGKVNLGLRKGSNGVLNGLRGVEITYFAGAHPVGNVGVQIHHVDPINKGETVWTMDIQNVAILGRLFTSGKVDMSKVIALTGSEIASTGYYSIISGAQIDSIVRPSNICDRKSIDDVRIISGNVLTGDRVAINSYIRFYSNMITVIPEGNKYEFLGWAQPRFDKFSVSRSYFSWLMPNKQYSLDTNLNGGERAFVMTGIYDKYLPMDIYPLYLLKAILAGDIDKMENLGIYEVIAEDLALCEFVDPSKNEIQQIVEQGISLMIKELN